MYGNCYKIDLSTHGSEDLIAGRHRQFRSDVNVAGSVDEGMMAFLAEFSWNYSNRQAIILRLVE